ncbi:MAG: FHA domain-containing protein [Verrucomicrobiae bacterium]|nr:FHA domain-containing protein [Verrucomicrobiae bacterium]
MIASDGQYQSLAGTADFTIGRSTLNHLVLEDSAVSRRHAILHRKEDTYLLQDLQSSNGTFVNGVSAKEALLKSGDIIQLGRFIFEFREGTESDIIAYIRKRMERSREEHPTTPIGIYPLLREEKIAGDLDDFPIVPIVQALISERKTGTLRIRRQNVLIGAVYFMNGIVIDAECSPAPEGKLAFFELLKSKHGRFSFEASSAVPRPPIIEDDSTALLLEGCRRLDEHLSDS